MTSQGERLPLNTAVSWLTQLVVGIRGMHRLRVRVEQAKTPVRAYTALSLFMIALLRSKFKDVSQATLNPPANVALCRTHVKQAYATSRVG